MRILIIDDEPVLTENVCLYLEEDGNHVEMINYIIDKQYLRHMLEQFQPEGVIVDYDMIPKGDTIYRWVREWSGSVPIVFYTKYADSSWHRDKMVEVGAAEEAIIRKVEVSEDVPKIFRIFRSS